MKKNSIMIILGAILLSSLTLINLNLNSKKNLFSSIDLKGYQALAACSNMEGINGRVAQMTNCYEQCLVFEGEYSYTVTLYGCTDAESSCDI